MQINLLCPSLSAAAATLVFMGKNQGKFLDCFAADKPQIKRKNAAYGILTVDKVGKWLTDCIEHTNQNNNHNCTDDKVDQCFLSIELFFGSLTL